MKKRTPGALIAPMVLALSIGMVGTASAAAPVGQQYTASAYGTQVTVAGLVGSGETSPVGFGDCGIPAPAGYLKIASTAGANVPNVLQTGVIDNTASTGPASGSPWSAGTSKVSNVSLLNGLISATAVKADSKTLAGAAGDQYSSLGSGLVGMTIAGLPMLGSPAPNTTIALPGVGKVILNQQVTRTTATGGSMTVNMIDVILDTAQAGLPAGTHIVVGHATSGLATEPPNAPNLRGAAFGAEAHVLKVVTLGEEFPVGMCGSTNGKTVTNSAAATSIPGILSTGTVANTVNGTLGSPTSTSTSTATVQGLSALSGLISVDAIKAQANATLTGGTVALNETGSSFTNLVVNGQAMPANVPPNTELSIGGLTVWLNRVIQTNKGITVRMIEIKASATNTFGLPIGADIQVASAMAGGNPIATS